MAVRPLIKGVIVSKHFARDLKDKEKVDSIVSDILECSHMEFNELHKFEENVNGALFFRAKNEDLHIVYCVDKKMRIVFLRAIRSFTEYEKFLDDKRALRKIVEELDRL